MSFQIPDFGYMMTPALFIEEDHKELLESSNS